MLEGFRVFYVDPPWTGPLPKQLPPVAAEGGLLFLWAPPAKLAEALRVIERWGFRYQNCLVWVGAGSSQAGALEQHELTGASHPFRGTRKAAPSVLSGIGAR